MKLRPHRNGLVVWSRSAVPDGPPGGTRPSRARRVRRRIRIGVLLVVLGVTRLTPRSRFLLAGVALVSASIALRHGPGSLLYFPGAMFLLTALFTPADARATRRRHLELERELAVYSTPAQRCDLEALLDRYPDGMTDELREILASQAMAGRGTRFPAAGRY
jgi:hypothetical protein